MFKSHYARFAAAAAALLFGAGLVLTTATRSIGGPQRSRAEFMRKKLDISKNVLEGLSLENFELIAQNARNLRSLSSAAEWEVPTIPHVEQYLAYTHEFQRLCDDLVRKARERNIDGATLAYVQLTLNCVNCHKFVRTTR
jgi:hypothetical protein